MNWEDRKGIKHEEKMRNAHTDYKLFEDADPNSSKRTIYNVMKSYCSIEEVENEDYTLITRFSNKSFLAKVANPQLRHLDILTEYSDVMFEALKDYADAHNTRVIQVMVWIVEGRVEINRDIFPMEAA